MLPTEHRALYLYSSIYNLLSSGLFFQFLSCPIAAQQAIDTPFPHMDGQIGHAVLLPVCFGKATGFDNIIAHVRIPPFRDGLSIPSQP